MFDGENKWDTGFFLLKMVFIVSQNGSFTPTSLDFDL